MLPAWNISELGPGLPPEAPCDAAQVWHAELQQLLLLSVYLLRPANQAYVQAVHVNV